MQELINQGDKRMTVKEVAESLGVDRSTVTRWAARLFPDGMQNGLATLLTEKEVTMIKQRIGTGRNDLCNVAQVENITTETEMRQKAAEVMAWLLRDNEQLKAKNAELTPKAAFFDQVADSKTAIDMRSLAAILNIKGIGRTKLFQILRDKKILDDRNIPYRTFQDRGYFRVIESSFTDVNGMTHIYLKTLVYQKGVDYILKQVTT